MKKIFLYTVVVVGIPFFVVLFWKNESEIKLKEIHLNYLSNVMVRVKREKTGDIQNVLLEEYVMGVVAGEMPVSFEIEALKAQSVASRSYVIRRLINNKDQEYDVVDTVSNQVYLDEDDLKNKWGDKYIEYINKIKTSVNDTSMEYLEYDGEVIDALFASVLSRFRVTFLPSNSNSSSSWRSLVRLIGFKTNDGSKSIFIIYGLTVPR